MRGCVKESEVLHVMQMLANVPTDSGYTFSARMSENGRHCFRCEASTKERTWIVDIYNRHFLWVALEQQTPVAFYSPRSVVLYLLRNLFQR